MFLTKKRIISMILILVTLCLILPLSVFAEKKGVEDGHVLNYRAVDYTAEEPMALTVANKAVTDAKALPTQYSSVTEGKSTPVKNQGSYGTCWAFSATSSSEASLNANGGGKQDLSELQLAYFFYNTKYDPLGNATGDKTTATADTALGTGGNDLFTMWSLASWTNGAPESALPYTSSNCTSANNGTLSSTYANDYDIAHLQNAYIIPYSTTTTSMNNVKNAIMQYGTVSSSYYHSSTYYNANTGAYYCKVSGSNHAVSIVGWNDNYPASNFNKKCRPSSNGAWLVKNSWGTDWGTDGDANATHSGRKGYFWISYYDSSLRSEGQFFVYDFEPVSNYQYNYQYDGSNGIRTMSLGSSDDLGAIYTVKGLTSDTEEVAAVGFGVASTNVSGTVKVYTDPQEGSPKSGTLAASVPFTTDYEGFYTVKLTSPVSVEKGHRYSVVVDFSSSCTVFVDSSYANGDWIRFTANTANDKTYKINGSTVTNLANQGYTARLKAYTNDADGSTPVTPPAPNTYTVTYNANGGSGAPAAQTKTENTTLTLSTTVPVRSGYNFLGWSEDKNAETASYSAGGSFTKNASVTLYAVWQMKKATSLSVSPTALELTVGESAKTVTVSPTPSDAVCDWKILNASKSGSTYTLNGLKITKSGNQFSVEASSYVTSQVTITFQEQNSGETVSCTVTVHNKSAEKSVAVSAKVTSSTSGKKITYKATITATAENTSVSRIQYSTNNGKKWLTGTSFTSKSNITSFLIRVTDSSGTVYNFRYSNGTVYKV